jgi:hypothetical protein
LLEVEGGKQIFACMITMITGNLVQTHVIIILEVIVTRKRCYARRCGSVIGAIRQGYLLPGTWRCRLVTDIGRVQSLESHHAACMLVAVPKICIEISSFVFFEISTYVDCVLQSRCFRPLRCNECPDLALAREGLFPAEDIKE